MAKLLYPIVSVLAIITVIVISAAALREQTVRNERKEQDGNGAPSSSLIYGPQPPPAQQNGLDSVGIATSTLLDGRRIYHSDAFGFEMQYPGMWTAEEINNTSSWVGDPDPPMIYGQLLTIKVPSSTIPASTNVSVQIFLGASTNTVDVSNCATGTPSQIGSTTFYRFDYSDASTGQFYNNVNYEIKRNGVCYAVQYLFTSGVGLSYVKIADYRTLVPLLDQVLQTFRFTD